jgi:hypothetical protein
MNRGSTCDQRLVELKRDSVATASVFVWRLAWWHFHEHDVFTVRSEPKPGLATAVRVGVLAAVYAHCLLSNSRLTDRKAPENLSSFDRSQSGMVVAPCGCNPTLSPSANQSEE